MIRQAGRGPIPPGSALTAPERTSYMSNAEINEKTPTLGQALESFPSEPTGN